MYQYDHYDQSIVDERVEEFRDQTRRYLAGELGEDEYLALRLMNGLYIQKHAPMLRVAIPYGTLDSRKMRRLAHIARTYDKGYGHFSTRQNIQFNWPELERVPDILAELAEVQMHAIQTSGNCIRNVTSDPLAGVAPDEIEDPRPYCEIIRQWSTFHPEFIYLPRKFKIAVSGAAKDRAAVPVHDIGVYIVRNEAGETGFRILAGGGLGRTPMLASVVTEFAEKRHLLSWLEAIVRVYNLHGRRDNKYKARIKILVSSLGAKRFAGMVRKEWEKIRDSVLELPQKEIDRVSAFFAPPPFDPAAAADRTFAEHQAQDREFADWVRQNTADHRAPGYRAVFVSLKAPDAPPGDITAEQMEAVADLAERYSFDEIRTTHDQNLLLPHVRQGDLYPLWQALRGQRLATPNIGLLTDMICCPGGDFCSLANARSIPVAAEINRRFDRLDFLHDIGEIQVKMSGCMNACGHHHVGHIGILGVDKKGEEFYQFTLGGEAGNEAAIGERLGPSIGLDQVGDAFEAIIAVYLEQRIPGERFIDTYRRIGIEPFKARVYGTESETRRAAAGAGH
ncbi:MAG: nitrite/sulfite reductase [Gammaproteobacteria bacterium]|nr:MAG: nitrite/sulfite reductase [Gammaproteobacteria bacterium]